MAHFATQRVVDSCQHHVNEFGRTAAAKAWPGSRAEGGKKRKLRIKSRPTTQKPAVEAQQSGWQLAGQWIDSIDLQALMAIPAELSPSNLDLTVVTLPKLPSLPDLPMADGPAHSLQDSSIDRPCQTRKVQRTGASSAVLDNGPSGEVTLPHLPDIQNDVSARSLVDVLDQRWAGHANTHSHSYQAFPAQWGNTHYQQRHAQPHSKQLTQHPLKRTAAQLSYSGAGLANQAQPHMAQHLASMPPLGPPQGAGHAHSLQRSTEAPDSQGLSVRQQTAALERLRQLSADLQAANERIAQDSQNHAQALEQERKLHKEEMQRLRTSEQALQDELQKERKHSVGLRKQLEEERLQHQAVANSGAETASLLKAMELRVGIQAPSELLTGRQEFLQQAEIAQKIWGQFESAAKLAGVASESSKTPSEGCKELEAAAKFDEAAHGVYKGLLATVMMLNSAAHQFQHGLDDVARRRGDLIGGRSRIREAQEKLRKVGALLSRLSEANALLASSGGTIERDEEYARRAVFVQAASVCQRRLITIGENEYLSYERISVQQTRQHAHAKHVEFVRLRETLKQLSPASDTSCADVASISPRSHARSGQGSGPGLNDATQTLLDLGQGFHAAQKRLEASVESALKITQEAPRLREDLLRLFNALGRVGSEDIGSKGRSIAWAMAAITGEFGCNVSQNVGTLQYAVETLKSLLSSEAAPKGKGNKRKVPL